MQLRKILCPVDFSNDSREAMEFAIELAAKNHAALALVHVWEPPLWLTSSEMPISGEAIQQIVDSEEQNLETWAGDARRLGAPDVSSSFLRGAAWDQVVQAAKSDPSVDLIVMGTRGRTGLKHALIGSVAEKVVRHAPCRVLVTRRRE